MKKYLFISLFLILLILVFTFPAILHMSNLLIGDGGDNYENFSFQFLAFEKIKLLEWPFAHIDTLRYPVGFNFATGYESTLTVLVGAFFSLFLSNVLAYNLTILLFYSLNGLLSFILFKHVSKSDLIGVIGAVIYGFSFFVIARSAGHINLFFLGGFILFIYSVLRLKESFSTKNIVLILTAGTLIILGSFLYTILLGVSFFLCLVLLMAFFSNETKKFAINIYRQKYKILLLAIPFIIIAGIFSFPHIQALITGDYNRPLRNDFNSLFYASSSLKDFIIPNSYLPLGITEITKNLNDSAKSIDKSVFLGWVEIVLFLLFAHFYKNRRLKYFILSSFSVFFVLSLGYIVPETKMHLPYYFLHNIFLFSFIDEPRFYPVMYLFMSMGIILFLKQIYKPNLRTFALFGLILTLIILERLPFNYWLTPTFANYPYVEKVKEQKTTAVFDIPVSYTNSPYHLLPYMYGKKIVSGTFQWFADTDKAKSFIVENGLTRFLCGASPSINQNTPSENQKLIELLRKNDIKTIVVHKNDLAGSTKFYFPECANMRMQTDLFLPQILEPNPSDQTQIISLFFPAVPQAGDTITFPENGTFTIEGVQAYPNDWLPVHMFLDGNEIHLDQKWKEIGNKISTSSPYLILGVKKGSKLRVQFDKNQNTDYSFVKFWYLYVTATGKNNPQFDSTNQIVEIYEDDDAAVFEIK